jgi:phage gp36-like protein
MGVNSYTNADEIRRRYPRLYETIALTPGEIEAVVDDVDLEIDGVFGTRYAVPFAAGQVPPLVRMIARDRVSYRVLRQQIIQEQPSTSDWVEKLKETSDKYLDAIIDGTLQLATGSGTTVPARTRPGDKVWSSTKDYVPAFAQIDMTEQVVDQARLDDETEERD